MTRNELIGEKRIELLNVPVDLLTRKEVFEHIDKCIRAKQNAHITSMNAHQLLMARHDPEYMSTVRSSEICHVDGCSIQIALRFLHGIRAEKVAGIDLMLDILQSMAYSVYFLGTRQEILEKMIDKVRADYPRLHISGYQNGYFENRDMARIAGEICASGAQILFVGMPSPKRDILIGELKKCAGSPVAVDVGGSFDVLAGAQRRAPKWMIDTKTEWLYRMIQEPGRLIQRNLKDFPEFLGLLLLEKIKMIVKGT